MKQGDKNSLPERWEMKKLGEVCTVIAGQSPEGIYYNSERNGLPFYQGKKEFRLKYIGEPTCWTSKITKEAEANDILMSVRAPVGPVNFATQKVCIGRGLAAIRAGKKIDNVYLFNYLLKHENEIIGNEGAVFNSINKSQIESIEIPLPPLEEQQRIVAKLDEAFEAIEKAKANAEQNLKNAKELFDSYLQAIFENKGKDWKEVPLADLATFRNGMNFTKSSNGEVIKIVGVRDFQNSFWVPFENLDSVIIDGELNDIDLLREDDILAVRSNGNPELIGRTLLAGKFEGKISHSGFTIRIRLNCKNVLPVYLCIYLKTQKVRKELINRGNGVGIKSLNQGSLASLLIHLPPVSEQQSIVQKLDALSSETKKLEANYQKKLEDLEELKKSILQKAFSGQL